MLPRVVSLRMSGAKLAGGREPLALGLRIWLVTGFALMAFVNCNSISASVGGVVPVPAKELRGMIPQK